MNETGRKMFRLLMLLTAASLFAACDGYPRDPRSSLQKAKAEELRVGVMNTPPWAEITGNKFSGIEVDLVEGFANSINTSVQWRKGSEEELMRMLEAAELHLVIGGITKKTPWAKHIGLTNVYLTDDVYVCNTKSTALPDSIKDLEIAVRQDSLTLVDVKKKGGVPVPVSSLAGYQGLVATSEQQTGNVRCQSPTMTLLSRKHVMAVPKGENALLMALEEYLNAAGY